MFFLTAKMSKKKAVVGVVTFGLLMCLLVVCAADRRAKDGDSAMDAMSYAALKTLKDGQARTDFLAGLGWEVDSEPIQTKQIVIPEEFDETYTQYNKIQADNGYDLSKYRGRSATLYTYIIKNHPSGEADVRANLIMYRNKLIGGDICSSKLDGFMTGLVQRPEQSE